MIEIAEAVAAAKQFVREAYGANALEDLLLEEVQRSEDESDWLITVGFSLPEVATRRPSPFAFPYPLLSKDIPLYRELKVVRVDGESGGVKSMTIREPQAAMVG